MNSSLSGKLIVIEGTDGSGKKTQTELLKELLESRGYQVFTQDFPRYDHESSYFVKKMLAGEYGELKDLPPKRTSLFYALDRFDASQELHQKLEEGYVVLLDRYMTANMGHQGGKLKTKSLREDFYKWLYQIEFSICGIPKPDRVLFLHVPSDVGLALAKKQNKHNLKNDIHENHKHLRDAEQAFIECSELFPEWSKIKCTQNDTLLSIPDIHQEIVHTLGVHFDMSSRIGA